MTANNPLPTPSASATATPTPASAAAASASQADPATAATGQAAQQQQQPSPAEAIETLLQQIQASNNEATLAGMLLNSLGTPDTRESVLASLTSAGTDPLDALDAARHTLGVLFILCVVLLLSSTFFRPLSLLRRVLPRFCIGMRCAPAANMLFYCFAPFFGARYLSIICFFFWLLGHIGTSLTPG